MCIVVSPTEHCYGYEYWYVYLVFTSKLLNR